MSRHFLVFLLAGVINLNIFVLKGQQSKLSDLYQLNAGNVCLIVDASLGARVVSLKMDGNEFLSGKEVHPENFGSTFWTSPQKDWGWPPSPVLDSKPYQTKKNSKGYLFTSGIEHGCSYQVMKQFIANEMDTSFTITYTIKNVSDTMRKVAAWEITRVPGSGITFFAGDTSQFLAESNLKTEHNYDLNWFVYKPNHFARKLYINGKGWLAFTNKNGLLVKSFPDNPVGSAAPVEEEVEVYVHPDITYIELENQSVYSELQPGQTFSWAVKWFLRKAVTGTFLPSTELKDEVNRILTNN